MVITLFGVKINSPSLLVVASSEREMSGGIGRRNKKCVFVRKITNLLGDQLDYSWSEPD